MRVTCKSCGAQYNLPDDKVQGRKAKVRCKKCSASIVVDGTSIAPGADGGESEAFEDEEATQVMRSPMAALGGANADPDDWTVNLSDDDQRQMTTDELVAGWLSGEVTEDAFVWRDGMGDWAAVPDVPELAEKFAAAEAARPRAVAAPAPAATPKPAIAAAKPSLPEAHRAQPKPALKSAPKVAAPKASAARPATFDLFGPPRSIQRDSHPKVSSPPMVSATASENSMVFSLDALKAAAAKEEAKEADTRASEDLLTLGTLDAPAPIGGPLIEVIPTAPPQREFIAATAGPVMPAAQEPQKKKTPVWIWGAGAAAVLLVGFFGGRVFMGEGEDSARAGTTVDPALAEAEEKLRLAEEMRKKAEEERKKAEEERKKAEAAAEQAEEEKQEDDKKDSPGTQAGGSGPSGGTASNSGSSSGSGSSGSSSGSSGSSSGSSGSSSGSSGKEASGGGGAKFSVAAARSALSAAAASAKSCKTADGPTGSGKVQVTFATSGRVTSARVVSGPFGGTSVGGCVARKFRSAKVPAFDGSPTTVAKSFSIK